MNYFFWFVIIIFYLNFAKLEKIVEINFYRDLPSKNTSDYSDFITTKLYATFQVGSFQKNINFLISFSTPYFSISSDLVENSTSFKALDPDFSFYSKTEFNSAQRAEEKIKINEKIIINNFKLISDKFGDSKLGLNLNFENNALLNFSFIKELIQNDLIETYDMKMLYNENNFTHGKIIFGSSPTFKIPMYIERTSIIVFRVDQVKYQEEDFTAELSLDFDSGGILVPGNFYKKIEKFFEPYIKKKTCNYVVLINKYESTIFCNENFNSFEKIDKIYFNINDFQFQQSLILEGRDLFIKVNNGYLFLIRTSMYYSIDKWVLGAPFIRKYPVTVNIDKKYVGFDFNMDNGNNDENQNNNNILPWILLGIFALVLIIVIGINLYIFVFKKKRKVRANELDDDILYEKKPEDERKLGI